MSRPPKPNTAKELRSLLDEPEKLVRALYEYPYSIFEILREEIHKGDSGRALVQKALETPEVLRGLLTLSSGTVSESTHKRRILALILQVDDPEAVLNANDNAYTLVFNAGMRGEMKYLFDRLSPAGRHVMALRPIVIEAIEEWHRKNMQRRTPSIPNLALLEEYPLETAEFLPDEHLELYQKAETLINDVENKWLEYSDKKRSLETRYYLGTALYNSSRIRLQGEFHHAAYDAFETFERKCALLSYPVDRSLRIAVYNIIAFRAVGEKIGAERKNAEKAVKQAARDIKVSDILPADPDAIDKAKTVIADVEAKWQESGKTTRGTVLRNVESADQIIKDNPASEKLPPRLLKSAAKIFHRFEEMCTRLGLQIPDEVRSSIFAVQAADVVRRDLEHREKSRALMSNLHAQPEFAEATRARGRNRALAIHADKDLVRGNAERGKAAFQAFHADEEQAKAHRERGRKRMLGLHANDEFAAGQSERSRKTLENFRQNPDIEERRVAGIRASWYRRKQPEIIESATTDISDEPSTNTNDPVHE